MEESLFNIPICMHDNDVIFLTIYDKILTEILDFPTILLRLSHSRHIFHTTSRLTVEKHTE